MTINEYYDLLCDHNWWYSQLDIRDPRYMASRVNANKLRIAAEGRPEFKELLNAFFKWAEYGGDKPARPTEG